MDLIEGREVCLMGHDVTVAEVHYKRKLCGRDHGLQWGRYVTVAGVEISSSAQPKRTSRLQWAATLPSRKSTAIVDGTLLVIVHNDVEATNGESEVRIRIISAGRATKSEAWNHRG